MGEEIHVENGRIKHSRCRDLDLDLGSGHTAYSTHRPLSTNQITVESGKLFWTDATLREQ